MSENKKIVVGTTNPAKLESVRRAFDKWFPENSFEIKGIQVESGVAAQPMSDKETLKGAINRAKACQDEESFADFWIGIEGGLEKEGKDIYAFAWMAVIDKRSERLSKSRTSNFLLPPSISDLVLQGMELGHADDQVFGRENSKHQDGAVGILTNGIITRSEYYAQALVLALIPFLQNDLYSS